MEDENVIKLPLTKKSAAAAKRPPLTKADPEKEARKRQKNAESVAVLGETDSSVKLLEHLVFGAEDELVERLVADEESGNLLLEDRDEESDNEEAVRHQLQPSKTAAWVDEDDELEEEVDMRHRFRRDLMRGDTESTMSKQKLQQRMKEQFQKSMGGTPSWAESSSKKKKTTGDDDDEEEDDLLRRTGNFVGSPDRLPGGILAMKRCCDANKARPSEDRLSSVQFHPSAQVVMTAGLDHSISLFQVDGLTNPKIQSIHLEQFPIHKAQFSLDGETVIATGMKNKMFYLYDMMEGRITPVNSIRGLNETRVKEFQVCPEGGTLLLTGTNGYLHLLTLKTKEVVHSVKMNGSVSGAAFSSDGSKLFANSDEGEVYVWDMRSSRCMNRFADDGCVKGTSIAASRDSRLLACGSHSGVVNVYSLESCLHSPNPKPLKSLMNLLTVVSSLTFNPTSDILAIASRAEDEAVRLIHLPSLTAFSNFGVTARKVIYRASCLDFSPHSGFFSLANNRGRALLYRLLHYKDF
ncbi:U3 small nucleolar RNA-associated protein 18 homolog isoform X2 [Betta splendens]|uniref:U3 small nucleolar RNA-associated protein 18 homolog n=1 Tax=Betta splendens TaxID=158456 RepID=A0A6P7N7X4_BETSP|nr:U3 small nucleolar RNA-associated protein 18 homolog isoform X2 [Betta splendens]